MNHARCDHLLEPIASKIIAVGGMLDDGTFVRSVESYDLSTDQWTVQAEDGFGGVVGGGTSNPGSWNYYIYFTTASSVDFYDWPSGRKTLKNVKLPSGCLRSRCAVMTLPNLL